MCSWFFIGKTNEDKIMKSKMIVLLCSLLSTGFVYAECPANMSETELIKCNQIEKSGMNYQDWKKSQGNLSNDSTISPITGKDVRSITPAAGMEKGKPKPAK